METEKTSQGGRHVCFLSVCGADSLNFDDHFLIKPELVARVGIGSRKTVGKAKHTTFQLSLTELFLPSTESNAPSP
jgi:hypothetical protein